MSWEYVDNNNCFVVKIIYNFDNKTLLYNNNCKSLMYCQHIPNSFFI